MLTFNEILDYIKINLSLPSGYIEFDDEEIKNYLVKNTLKEFSIYYPDFNRFSIITDNINYKVPGKKNWYLIKDPEDLEIIAIRKYYIPLNSVFFAGHPIQGVFGSVMNAKEYALSVFNFATIFPHSPYFPIFKFYPPNNIEVQSDSVPEYFTVEYERVHPPDLRRMPTTLHQVFKELCLADIMILIGNKRSLYGDGKLTTPFGEIPLSGDNLLSKGTELKSKTIDRLIEDAKPSVIIDTY